MDKGNRLHVGNKATDGHRQSVLIAIWFSEFHLDIPEGYQKKTWLLRRAWRKAKYLERKMLMALWNQLKSRLVVLTWAERKSEVSTGVARWRKKSESFRVNLGTAEGERENSKQKIMESRKEPWISGTMCRTHLAPESMNIPPGTLTSFSFDTAPSKWSTIIRWYLSFLKVKWSTV